MKLTKVSKFRYYREEPYCSQKVLIDYYDPNDKHLEVALILDAFGLVCECPPASHRNSKVKVLRCKLCDTCKLIDKIGEYHDAHS